MVEGMGRLREPIRVDLTGKVPALGVRSHLAEKVRTRRTKGLRRIAGKEGNRLAKLLRNRAHRRGLR
jgi:hypothetical protein